MAERDMDEVVKICPVFRHVESGEGNPTDKPMELCLRHLCVFWVPPMGFKPAECLAFNAVLSTKAFLIANGLRQDGRLAPIATVGGGGDA